MTPDQLIEQAKLAIRWAESVKAGKVITIQVKSHTIFEDIWETTLDPQWQLGEWEYREKPRPREYWIIERPNCPASYAFSDLKTLEKYADEWAINVHPIHMREVVE